MQTYKIRPREAAQEAISSYLKMQRLRPGDRLPSEREMSELWAFNRCTLRSAVSRLERDGVLEVRRNSGIYMAQPKFVRSLQDLKSFTEETQHQGRQGSTRLLALEVVECDKQFSRRFQQILGTPLWRLSRLRSVDGVPVQIETSYLLRDRFPELDHFDLERQSLFAILEEHYHAVPDHGDETISITQANAAEAGLLELADGAPVFRLVSQTLDRSGELLEYCNTVARGDKLVLTSILERREPQ